MFSLIKGWILVLRIKCPSSLDLSENNLMKLLSLAFWLWPGAQGTEDVSRGQHSEVDVSLDMKYLQMKGLEVNY